MTHEEIRVLAAQLFVTYMDDNELIERAMSQRGPLEAAEYIAACAFEDAEVFAKVAKERKETP